MAKFLILSNGHGEDLSGSLLGQFLISKGHDVDAFPLVGKGKCYTNQDIKIYGSRKEFSTGGMGYITLKGRLTEFFQGQFLYLLKNFILLFKISRKYDILIAVGDVIPVLGTWMTRRPSVVYLVAYSSHYEGKLRLPWPANRCLRSKNFLKVFSRDQLTSEDLSIQLRRSVDFLGNPFMDSVFKYKKSLSNCSFRLGILPGSRRPELDNNIVLLLKTILLLPKEMQDKSISLDIALVSSLDAQSLNKILVNCGWEKSNKSFLTKSFQYVKDFYILNIHYDSFPEILNTSDLLLSMAGTAAEQAIGLSKPVIQLPGKGPQFTQSFAEAQRRLLGPTVFCANQNPQESEANILRSTANLIYQTYQCIQADSLLKKECNRQSKLRIGESGATQRICESIQNLI